MRTDADGALAARFAATFDPLDTSDWDDVLRRATSVRRGKRHVMLIAVAIALIVVPISIGFRGPIHNLFFDSPAPTIIKRSFAEQNEMRIKIRQWAKEHHRGNIALAPYVDASKAHGVIAIKTSDGLLSLWAAPTSGGRECWFISFARDAIDHKLPIGDGSCDRTIPPTNIHSDFGWSYLHPTLKVLSGRLYVTNAVAVLADIGTPQPVRVPVVDRYFLHAFPNDVKVKNITAIDAHGRVVAGQSPRTP